LMTPMMKWLVGSVATLATFILCLSIAWVMGIRLWPHALHSTADRWVVAAAFATVMGTLVLTWAGSWAASDKKAREKEQGKLRSLSIQDVHASEGGIAYGVQHGSQHIYHDRPVTGSEDAASTENDDNSEA